MSDARPARLKVALSEEHRALLEAAALEDGKSAAELVRDFVACGLRNRAWLMEKREWRDGTKTVVERVGFVPVDVPDHLIGMCMASWPSTTFGSDRTLPVVVCGGADLVEQIRTVVEGTGEAIHFRRHHSRSNEAALLDIVEAVRIESFQREDDGA